MRRVICKTCGETKPHYAHGMCKRCYRRWLAEDSRRECLGCHRVMRMHSRGLCGTCYKRLLKLPHQAVIDVINHEHTPADTIHPVGAQDVPLF